LATLVVATKHKDAFGCEQFEAQQVENALNAIEATIDVVTQEEVVGRVEVRSELPDDLLVDEQVT